MFKAKANVVCCNCGTVFEARKSFEDKNEGMSWISFVSKSKRMCYDCYNALMLNKIKETEKAFDLPLLLGKSEKQTFYARKLRYYVVSENVRVIEAFIRMYDRTKLTYDDVRMLSKEHFNIIYYSLFSDSAKDIIQIFKK